MLSVAAPIAIPDYRSPEERRLLAENRRLRHKIEALETALYGADRRSLLFPLSARNRVVMDLLMRHAVVYQAQALAALEAFDPTPDGREKDVVDIIVCRYLRPMLRQHGVEIRSKRFGGHWIVPEHKVVVRRVFGVEVVG